MNTFMSPLASDASARNQKDILLDHNYDGIKEFDNKLPPWWVYMFYITILFAFVYFSYYHVFRIGELSKEEYANEMALAEQNRQNIIERAGLVIDENNAEKLTTEQEIGKGNAIFHQYCFPCHGNLGEGGIGPNLTDEYWIHGGSFQQLFTTIKYGVPDKGMISWQTQLKPEQIQQVASYVVTLQGTNPPNAKEPQGDKYTD